MKRTDLALEIRESIEGDDREIRGVVLEEKLVEEERIKVTKVVIRNRKGAQAMGKPMGTYITLEMMGRAEEIGEKAVFQSLRKITAKQLRKMISKICENEPLPGGEKERPGILVAGLGNREATPDSLGPRVVKNVSACASLCAVSPGVMAQTGMETYDILAGIIEKVKPSILVVVDALAARNTARLMRTIQITDTGICPGAGIGNYRKALNKENIGIPVIAIGVPTVVDARTLCADLSGAEAALPDGEELFVTPRDIDSRVRDSARLVGYAVNLALHDALTIEDIDMFLS